MTFNLCYCQVFDNVSYYKKYSPEQLHSDVDFLLKKFKEIHPNYYNKNTREVVEKKYDSLKTLINRPMTRIDFMNLFAPVAFGIIKDGHNYVNAPEEDLKLYTDNGGKFFPLPLRITSGKLFVNSASAELPYDTEIISINNLSSKMVVQKVLSTYNPESETFREIFLSDDFSKLYWLSYGQSDLFKIEFKGKEDNTVRSMTISSRDQSDIEKLRGGNNSKHPNYVFQRSNYGFYELPEINAGFIDFKSCDDLENFRPFCDSVFTVMKQKKYKNLIIDIRRNIGGTTRLGEVLFEYLTNKPIAQYDTIDTKVSQEAKKDFISMNRKYAGWFKWYNYLYYPIYIRSNHLRNRLLTAKNGNTLTETFTPKQPIKNSLLFEGKIYLFTSTYTYSSAAIFAAAFKCYNIGDIIGQETGQPTCFTGDGIGITLPNTKLDCSISFKKFNLACGKCDGHGVLPDYTVDNANNSKSVDLELEKAKEMMNIRKKSN